MTDDEIKSFLVVLYVENKNRWEPTAKRVAKLFLKGYYDNLGYINRHFETFLREKNQIKITSKEYKKLAIIVDLVELRKMVRVVNNDLEINYHKISKTFQEAPRKDKGVYQRIITEMSLENEQVKLGDEKNEAKQVSLKELYQAYNYLIGFVKTPDFRKKYYQGFLTNKGKKILDYADFPRAESSYFGVATFS